jgi:hypothetical protein
LVTASARKPESLAKALDQLGEGPGLLRRSEVATGKLGGLDRIAEPLPRQAQLPCLESVLAAADEVETQGSPKLRGGAREVPARSVLAMKNRTYSLVERTVSTVKNSQAIRLAA